MWERVGVQSFILAEASISLSIFFKDRVSAGKFGSGLICCYHKSDIIYKRIELSIDIIIIISSFTPAGGFILELYKM